MLAVEAVPVSTVEGVKGDSEVVGAAAVLSDACTLEACAPPPCRPIVARSKVDNSLVDDGGKELGVLLDSVLDDWLGMLFGAVLAPDALALETEILGAEVEENVSRSHG